MSTFRTIIRLVLSFSLFVLTSGFSQAQESAIDGTITGIAKTPIQFWYSKGGERIVDTVYAKNDHFTYKPEGSDDSTLTIYIKGSRLFNLWIEPGTVIISGSIEQPARLLMSGGPENSLQHQYNTSIDWLYNDLLEGKADSLKTELLKVKSTKTIEFIRSHLNNRVTANLLYWQSIYNEAEVSTYDQIWKTFKPEIQRSKQGARLSQRLETILNQPTPGKPAPSFAISDSSGNLVSLKDFSGKYVLLDFWGHWCGPCIKAFPMLKALNDRLLGKMQILGIAAEHGEDREKWLNMIRLNNLNWIQLSELQSDKGKVNTDYNIVAYPTYYLVDKEGMVHTKTNSIKDIELAIEAIPDLK